MVASSGQSGGPFHGERGELEVVMNESTATVAEVEVKVSRSKVPAKYRQAYGKAGNNGDDIAAILKGADIAAVALENGIDLNRWAGKNAGMVRMNLGNVLRGMVRRGEKVTIAGQMVSIAA